MIFYKDAAEEFVNFHKKITNSQKSQITYVSVSARSSKLPVGERCVPVGEQSSQCFRLRTGMFPFANGLVCEKNSFLFTLPTLSHGFHQYPVITNGQVPVDKLDSTQWQTEEY